MEKKNHCLTKLNGIDDVSCKSRSFMCKLRKHIKVVSRTPGVSHYWLILDASACSLTQSTPLESFLALHLFT